MKRIISLFFSTIIVASVVSYLYGNLYGSQNIKNISSSDMEMLYQNVASKQCSYVFKGNKLIISYNNGKVKATVPLNIDANDINPQYEKGIYISNEKTVVAYGGDNSPVKVLISNNMGKTWNVYTVKNKEFNNRNLIGFINKNDGWIVVGNFMGMNRQENSIYQTSDGGKTWSEIGNANNVYPMMTSGAGFSTYNIGFLCFRYYTDYGPTVYWTQNRGRTWSKLKVTLPKKYSSYRRTPLSPSFYKAAGLFPIQLYNNNGYFKTIYLISKDYGKTWRYDEKYNTFAHSK